MNPHFSIKFITVKGGSSYKIIKTYSMKPTYTYSNQYLTPIEEDPLPQNEYQPVINWTH